MGFSSDFEASFWSPPDITIHDYQTTSLEELADSTVPSEIVSVELFLNKLFTI